MKTKKRYLQIIRHTIQLISFIMVPGLFIILFTSIGSIAGALLAGTFTFSEYGNSLFLLLAVLIATAIFGRYFCGFICAFGSMQDVLRFGGKQLYKKKIVSEKADRWLKLLKYVVLAFIIIGVWILNVTGSLIWSPWTVFGLFTDFGNLPALSYVLSVGGLIFLGIMVGSFFIDRFFCRYLCPMGAVFSVISKFRVIRIKKPSSNCGNCRLCSAKCSMSIPLQGKDKVTSGECINCMECVSACAKGNVRSEVAPTVTGVVVSAAVAGVYFVGNLPATEEKMVVAKSITGVPSSDVSASSEEYTGTGKGYRGNISVTVKMSDGVIEDITIDSYKDDRQFFEKAESRIISAILESQSTDVSTVSGATFSSRGIIEAVEDALSGIEINDIKDNEKVIEAPENEKDEDEKTTSANKQNNGSFADGTYEGSGTGFRGATKVSVTVKDGKIDDITIKSYQDDSKYFNRASETMIDRIIDAQSTDVSTVSGATFSSNSIIEAVSDALNIEFTNPNQSNQSGRGHGKRR